MQRSTPKICYGAAGLASPRLRARDTAEFRRVDGWHTVFDPGGADMYGCATGTSSLLLQPSRKRDETKKGRFGIKIEFVLTMGFLVGVHPT
jgi:hypothetical protein